MKTEVWLYPNRRALAFGFALPAFLTLAGLALITGCVPAGWMLVGYVLGWGLIVGGALMAGGLLALWRTPRLAYRDGMLLVYLRGYQPLRVPVDVVECFFLGQGESQMPASGSAKEESSTIVVRLAESAHEWNHVEVKRSLGHWCDGYITIRGTWCEPINAPLMKRLNERLVAIHRERRASAKEPSA